MTSIVNDVAHVSLGGNWKFKKCEINLEIFVCNFVLINMVKLLKMFNEKMNKIRKRK